MLNAEVVKQDLANSEVEQDNKEEARIVEEEVSGEAVEQMPQEENTAEAQETEKLAEENVAENDLERVTEIMAVETQEDSKNEENQ